MAKSNSNKCGNRCIDLTGHVFGKWTVIEFHSLGKHREARWLCRCDCGTERPVFAHTLRGGTSTGCRNCACSTHRKTKTTEYRTWDAMLSRCRNGSNKGYHRYGGRGIKVCEGWLTFTNFLADMGLRPISKTSLDRINNEGNYSCGHCEECTRSGWPANCRWATFIEQNRNTRANRMLTFSGKTMCLADWADETNINADVLGQRVKAGWSSERALTTPVEFRKPRAK